VSELTNNMVLLGNANPQHTLTLEDGSTVSVAHPFINQSETRVEFWAGFDDPESVAHTASTQNDRFLSMVHRILGEEHKQYTVAVTELEQILAVHTAGNKPMWVDSPNAKLAEALAAFYDIPLGEPTALLTNAGRDAVHAQAWGTSAQPAAANYIALTASVTAPAATDTTLTGEITTAGGGLLRAQATYAHTASTNTSTLTKTFTANGSDSLPVTIAQIGVFNAASAGTLGFHTALTSTAVLSVSGDSVTVTETVTAG
jgi:hypothetical protein